MVVGQILTENGVTFWRLLPATPDPSITTYSATHLFYEQTLRRVEVGFRLNVEGQKASIERALSLSTGREDSSKVTLEVCVDGTSGDIVLRDAATGSEARAPRASGWLRATMRYKDSEGGEAELLDESGSVLATLKLSPETSTGTFELIAFESKYESGFKSVLDVRYVTLTYDAKPPMFDQPAIDPNNPAWAPRDGWTEVHQFDSASDALSLFEGIISGGIANGMVCLSNNVNEMTSVWVDRDGEFYQKIAMAMKFVRAEFAESGKAILQLYSDKAKANGVRFELHTVGGERKMMLIDWNNPDQQVHIPVPDGWFVLVVEVLNRGGVLRLHDATGNVIGEYALARDVWPSDSFFMRIISRNKYITNDTWSILIDWIALKRRAKGGR